MVYKLKYTTATCSTHTRWPGKTLAGEYATNEVMWSCNVITIEHDGEKNLMQIVSVSKGTLGAPALT